MFKVILWDVDGTLLNFRLSESNSLKKTFKAFSLGECPDETVSLYSGINNKYWEMLERGEITKSEVLSGRFKELFETLSIDGIAPSEFSDYFENGLCDTVEYIENAKEIIKRLKGNYRQYAVTNGAYTVQKVKLEKSGISDIFDGIFISDSVGFEKPSKEFFDFVLNNIIPCKREEILIIGDSLTSDMKGGNGAKIKCCWYNPNSIENKTDLIIDYEIDRLDKIFDILK